MQNSIRKSIERSIVWFCRKKLFISILLQAWICTRIFDVTQTDLYYVYFTPFENPMCGKISENTSLLVFRVVQSVYGCFFLSITFYFLVKQIIADILLSKIFLFEKYKFKRRFNIIGSPQLKRVPLTAHNIFYVEILFQYYHENSDFGSIHSIYINNKQEW